MAVILQTTFANPLSWMKNFEWKWNQFPFGLTDNKSSSVQLIAWCLKCDRPFVELPLKPYVLFQLYGMIKYGIDTPTQYQNVAWDESHAVESHDDVIKWKHFPRYWSFVRGIHRSPANSPHKGQRRGALMFSLIFVWINGWVNNREAGDFRRYRAHYDVIVMPDINTIDYYMVSHTTTKNHQSKWDRTHTWPQGGDYYV